MTLLEIAQHLDDGTYWRITDAPLTKAQQRQLVRWAPSSSVSFFQSLKHRMWFVLFVAAAEGKL